MLASMLLLHPQLPVPGARVAPCFGFTCFSFSAMHFSVPRPPPPLPPAAACPRPCVLPFYCPWLEEPQQLHQFQHTRHVPFVHLPTRSCCLSQAPGVVLWHLVLLFSHPLFHVQSFTMLACMLFPSVRSCLSQAPGVAAGIAERLRPAVLQAFGGWLALSEGAALGPDGSRLPSHPLVGLV